MYETMVYRETAQMTPNQPRFEFKWARQWRAAKRLFTRRCIRILEQVNAATERAQRVARSQSGTLRVGFTENASWRGVPDSLHRFRERYPDAELRLRSLIVNRVDSCLGLRG